MEYRNMITKFKLYENIKPDKDDDDFKHDWSVWSRDKLDSEFGSHEQGGNADWGGLTIWSICNEDEFYLGYFIVALDDNNFSFMKRSIDSANKYDEYVDTEFFEATPEDDNLEELIDKVHEILPNYKRKKKRKDFNL